VRHSIIKGMTEFQASSENQSETGLSREFPLCVDMDGTLLKTDSLIESIISLLKSNGLYLVMLCFWMLRGKACLKHELARRVVLDVARLPFRSELLNYLREQHGAGRKLVLVTGAHRDVARRVADHLGLFDDVLATEGETNLTGGAKLQALNKLFGEKGYDYAGNERADLIIWEHARNAIVVGTSDHLLKRAQHRAHVTKVVDLRVNPLRDLLRAIRPQQWVKNILLFVPLITSHQIAEGRLGLMGVIGFVAFSFVASSVYVLNDLLDMESDRQHPSKRERPFASGNLSPWWGIAIWPLLLGGGFGVASVLPGTFVVLLALYFVGSTAYSVSLKKRAIVDVLVLAGLYTIRIYAGSEAIGVILSPWLLAFSGFVFLSLAFIKRGSELLMLEESGGNSVHGRGYSVDDAQFVFSVGPASGYMACLVLALYVSSPDVVKLYSHPRILWLLCPLILYWISRTWLLCSRKKMPQDPIVFAVRDRTSYLVGAVAGLIMMLAK
jgi:4-hydroxybenzoate polyprenyltransferase/phosphoserine phosphatase